ncbi:protein of unknown function [Microbulbifer donghaiensis]|uniref:DUF4336 domain-containing protein n=1 Tax=Microbulbifer donghaiensis TaxID=494016 RepID=A0A1M5GME5_9GAMM|nr:DUF4336 domain-containing protein [Microbulbifer donghaiensis]SHG04838.1 protein of unknown function [Microbulbifer donghaiensis]
MSTHTDATYPPLNQLKPVAENVWIVDGPLIQFPMPWLRWVRVEFPTRMTIFRLAGGDLLLHSPTLLTGELRNQIEQIGRPRWIIGPNRIHYWWIPDWHKAFPDSRVYLAPRVREQAGKHLDFDTRELVAETGYPWDSEVDTLPVRGSYMTEVEFFHRASRTLVLTDLIENFESSKLNSWIMRWFTKFGGVRDPDGQMPKDMRATFRKPKGELRRAVNKMIGWNPERIIVAHGRWYRSDGARELRRAFRWLLEQ